MRQQPACDSRLRVRTQPCGRSKKRDSGTCSPEPSKLQIEVQEPAVVHEVNVGQVQRWLDQGSTNPSEEAKRKRLRELLVARP
jgi:hypothetical protein